MAENVYVGNRLVSVLLGEHYGEVVRDSITGDIILIENNKIVALGCTSDAKDNIIDFWEKKLNNMISFRLSLDPFKNTGLSKAIVLPPKRKFEEEEKDEIHYLKRELEKNDKKIVDLNRELNIKDDQIMDLLKTLRSINDQTRRF